MKISIRTLLALVAFFALGSAGLTQGSVIWLRLIFSLAVAFLAWSVVAAIYSQGAQRVFWMGVVVFSGGYYLLLGGSSLTGERSRGSFLATHQLLVWSGGLLGYETHYPGVEFFSERGFDDYDPYAPSGWTPVAPGRLSPPNPNPYSPPNTSYRLNTEPTDDGSLPPQLDPLADNPPSYNPYSPSQLPRTTLPPPASFPVQPAALRYPARFFLIGHSLFLILIGLAGGTVARWQFGGEQKKSSTP